MRPATTLLRVAFYLSGDPFMNYNPFMTVNNRLMMGEYAVSDLARTYQTPLYLMDEALIRSKMRTLKKIESQAHLKVECMYASKAFLNLAMAHVVKEEGLSLDVVSGGELYTAIKAQFPPERIYFHGNNKSPQELQMALDYQVGTIVLDNPYEVETILACQPKHPVTVMLRVNPELHHIDTHAYITTGHHDSKFGMSLLDNETEELIKRLTHDERFNLKGLHVHLGSQIQDIKTFLEAVEVLLGYYRHLNQSEKIALPWLNLGGGFGVAYTEHDQVLDLEFALPQIIAAVESMCLNKQVPLEKLLFEPGRSLVANAGITVYEVQAIKSTPSGKQYVFVDGSMADHIRTALYQAKYEAALVDRMDEPKSKVLTIAGKACESGDILIHDLKLPEPKVHDYICVFTTGAYHYSMSSNYNRLTRPAVIFVNQSELRVVNERESYEDLLAKDRL
jgi:diaminopimelate decarboxylase